jgi:hypothetical protein
VSKANSRGARILLLKSAEGNEAMQTVAIKKAFTDGNFHKAMSDAITLRKRHEISADAFNQLYLHAASVAFPLAKSWEAPELYRQTPGGSKMFYAGLEADFADQQRDTAAVNRSLVEKAKKPVVHAEQPEGREDREPDEDPDDQLAKLGEAYRRAHPQAKFSKEAAIAYAMEHDPDGRRLAAASKRKQMAKLYGEKHAAIFDKAQSATARTDPPQQPAVRVDPRNREQLDSGTSAVYAGHQDGKDFDAKVAQLMHEQQISRDEAISQLYVAERRAKFGW